MAAAASGDREWLRGLDADGAAALAAGTIAESTLGAEEVVVWRTADGRPCVMEARCPHQWSHLGSEGTVDGEELVCLTHFWRFTTTGEGWKAGMTGRRDRKGDIGVHPCREDADGIWVRLPD